MVITLHRTARLLVVVPRETNVTLRNLPIDGIGRDSGSALPCTVSGTPSSSRPCQRHPRLKYWGEMKGQRVLMRRNSWLVRFFHGVEAATCRGGGLPGIGDFPSFILNRSSLWVLRLVWVSCFKSDVGVAAGL